MCAISRRQVLSALAAVAGGVGLAGVGRTMGAELPAPESTPDPSLNLTFLPAVAHKAGGVPRGAVVHVRHPGATHWIGEAAYWEHIDQAAVDDMVNRGLMALTGTTTVAGAWRTLLPRYRPGEKIAIKINLNNSRSCADTDPQIDALVQPINALVVGLEQIGVARQDVCVYDGVRWMPDRLVAAGLPGLIYYDNGSCQMPAGYDLNDPAAQVAFAPPPGVTVAAEFVPNVLRQAAYLINMPIVKGNHPLAGVTLGYKNHFGTIHNPGGLHTFVNVVAGTARTDYSPLVDFYASPLIGGKLVLTVGDALFGARVFNQAPAGWNTFAGQVPNSLFLATDPVAADCVMHDFLRAELPDLPFTSNHYLSLAAGAGQGVFESIDPWSQIYQDIRYQRIDLQA